MMMKMLIGMICAVAYVILSPALAEDGEAIKGARSTFAAAAYTSWAFTYIKEKNVIVKYQPIGSGDGVRQIIAKTIDFAASDYALPTEDLKKYDLVQFPTLVSGVVPVVNLPGVKSGKLSLIGQVLADILREESQPGTAEKFRC